MGPRLGRGAELLAVYLTGVLDNEARNHENRVWEPRQPNESLRDYLRRLRHRARAQRRDDVENGQHQAQIHQDAPSTPPNPDEIPTIMPSAPPNPDIVPSAPPNHDTVPPAPPIPDVAPPAPPNPDEIIVDETYEAPPSSPRAAASNSSLSTIVSSRASNSTRSNNVSIRSSQGSESSLDYQSVSSNEQEQSGENWFFKIS